MPTKPKKNLRFSGDGGMAIKDIGGERLRMGVVNVSNLTPSHPGGPPSGTPASLFDAFVNDPGGGSEGQVLTKRAAATYGYQWDDAPSGAFAEITAEI